MGPDVAGGDSLVPPNPPPHPSSGGAHASITHLEEGREKAGEAERGTASSKHMALDVGGGEVPVSRNLPAPSSTDEARAGESIAETHNNGFFKTETNHNVVDSDSSFEEPKDFHGGIYFEEMQAMADLTETDVSDNMLFEGMKDMIDKSKQRKEQRKSIRKQSKKRPRAHTATTNLCLNESTTAAYSRCSIRYFGKVVKSVCESNIKMGIVRDYGFGYLMELVDCHVPRPFAQWIADNVSTQSETIVLNDKQIPLNAEAVSLVLGLPTGSTTISTIEEEVGKLSFLSLFGKSEVPTIKYFGNKVMKEDLSNEDFIRCFLIVALSTFLCPTSNTKPSTKYMGCLVDISKIRELNWCKFVHDWSIFYIKKYQTEKKKQKRVSMTLGGCIYYLAVRCLDFTEFGPIKLASTLPRICFWKGDLIKNFSDMLLLKDGLYRALPVKEEADTCYAEAVRGFSSTVKNSNFRNAITRIAGNTICDQQKEDILLSFQKYMKDESLDTCSKVKQIILDTLRIVTSANLGAADTVKIGCSENEGSTSIKGNDSTRTVVVDSNGIKINNDVIQRKKRKSCSQQSTSSRPVHSSQQQNTEGEEKVNIAKKRKQNENEDKETEVQDLNKENISTAGTEIFQGSVFYTRKQQRDLEHANIMEPEQHKAQDEQPQKSTSLNYMLLAANLANVLRTSTEDTISKMTSTEDKLDQFSGFSHQKLNAEGIDDRGKQIAKESHNEGMLHQTKNNIEGTECKKQIHLNIDINEAATSEKTKGETKELKLHPLDEARKKYFFLGDETPTCRLLETEDDCGNEITEHELWRPIGMDSQTYNAQIEDAKKNYHDKTTTVENNISDQEYNFDKQQRNSTIDCAQRSKQDHITEIDGIVDLTSPMAKTSTLWNREQTCYAPLKTEFNDQTGSCNKANKKSSPEVQILGERFFRESCTNMVNSTDDQYNIRLTLGSSRSSKSFENIPPKRIIHPSRFNSSPYRNEDRGPLMPHEVALHGNIMALSKIEPHRSSWVVMIDNTKISMGQLGDSFSKDGWVEAYVINV